MILSVKTSKGGYPIYLERGGLARIGEYFNLKRRCMIVTDSNIPKEYVDTVAASCGEAHVFTIVPSEFSKTLSSLEAAVREMIAKDFTRGDCVIAVGGGVVGDLAGFIAASYLRGVDFYNVPTTVLSQVDSSVGGKVGVNFDGLKNMVGAFYPPCGVLCDADTLRSLPARQIANGLAEAVKMAATCDEALFALLEKGNAMEHIEQIVKKSLRIKQRVVEQDEKETGLRRVLNFGHTLAHALEKETAGTRTALYHGECVALGMIPMTAESERARLTACLEAQGLPTSLPIEPEALAEAMLHDKKRDGDEITLVRCDRIGSFRLEKIPVSRLTEEMKGWKK